MFIPPAYQLTPNSYKLSFYQLDFLTPGIMPSFASSRKQIRHKSKSRMYPRFLPHLKHLRTTRDLNFGGLFERATADFFAINKRQKAHIRTCGDYGSNGARACQRHQLASRNAMLGVAEVFSLTLCKYEETRVCPPKEPPSDQKELLSASLPRVLTSS